MNACSPYTLFIKPVDEFSVLYSTVYTVPDIPEYRRVQYSTVGIYSIILYCTVPVYCTVYSTVLYGYSSTRYSNVQYADY